jgi:Fic family protein
MSEQVTELWQPIEFSAAWTKVDTSILDDLAPSWFRRRNELKEGNSDYQEFLERLKRQHAIETGVVEKLYDLSEGITETFIKEGFVESYLSHDDTNIPPQQLMGYLKSHFDAMDFIFELVKNERPLSISFVKQLHQLITKHQDYTVAINSLGQRVNVALLKGEFKKHENNPKREDGKIIKYCAPIQVDSEMDKLIEIHLELQEKNINPIVISAWVHHAFTQIHPFQDGNGRIARLLASLILIRGGLFPFTVKREEKVSYIDALEKADVGKPQSLVTFFSNVQKRNIENALNYKSEKLEASFEDVAKLFSEKVNVLSSRIREQRQNTLDANRKLVFANIYSLLGSIRQDLFAIIPYEKAQIRLESVFPDDEKYFWHTQQIAEYATIHNYYFNKFLPRGWFKIQFTVAKNKRYDLIFSVHHFSYDDSVIAVGSFLEYLEYQPENKEDKTTIPINLKPFTISLEGDSRPHLRNLDAYIRDIVKVGLTIIANEIV